MVSKKSEWEVYNEPQTHKYNLGVRLPPKIHQLILDYGSAGSASKAVRQNFNTLETTVQWNSTNFVVEFLRTIIPVRIGAVCSLFIMNLHFANFESIAAQLQLTGRVRVPFASYPRLYEWYPTGAGEVSAGPKEEYLFWCLSAFRRTKYIFPSRPFWRLQLQSGVFQI